MYNVSDRPKWPLDEIPYSKIPIQNACVWEQQKGFFGWFLIGLRKMKYVFGPTLF